MFGPIYSAVYNIATAGTTKGSFTINSGYGFEENIGHDVVSSRSSNGSSRVGCGALGKKGKTGSCA